MYQRISSFFLLVTALFTLTAAAQNQAASAASTTPTLEQAKRIEQNVRAHFKVPARIRIEVGALRPSDLAGFDAVTITVVNGERRNPYDFYLSKDGNTLAQLTKMDVSQNPFDTTGRPSRGAGNAKVDVVVWDDFQCPYCAMGYKILFDEVLPQYKDNVRVVYKDFPLTEIHPWATHAAVDANCLFAQSNDAYWDFAAYVHGNQKQIRGENRPLPDQFAALDHSAFDTGKKYSLDAAKLEGCVKTQDASGVLASVKYGDKSLGIDSTPAIYVNGTLLVGGAVPAEEVEAAIDEALRMAGAPVPEKLAAKKPAPDAKDEGKAASTKADPQPAQPASAADGPK